MSCCVYRATSEVGGAWRGPAGTSGPAGILGLVATLEDPGSFDPRGSLWSSSSDLLEERGLVGASWPLRAGRPCPLTEVIFLQTDRLTRWVW